jgi:transcriptional regulator with XRE-family HTH domain
VSTINDQGLSLAKRMRLSRQMADLDQQQMADRLGVARTTVSTWERGETEPSATNFVGWAQITQQPLEWLAEGVVRPKGLEPLTFCFGDTPLADEVEMWLLSVVPADQENGSEYV